MQFFGGDHRETFGQIKSHLVAKNGFCPCAGTVSFVRPFLQDVPHQVQVSVHASTRPKADKEALRPSSLGLRIGWQKQEVAWRTRVGRISKNVFTVDGVKQCVRIETDILNFHALARVTPPGESAQHVDGGVGDTQSHRLPYVLKFFNVFGRQFDDAKFVSSCNGKPPAA